MPEINTPLLLTLVRLIVSPLLLPFLLVYLLPFNIFWLNVFLALIFTALGVTDFFDGYLARKYNQETVLGKVLDPLADKCLTTSAFIALACIGKIYFYFVIVLILREFFVLGIRHAALEYHFSVPVSWLGKIKTAMQMLLLVLLIANPYQQEGLSGAVYWNGCEYLLTAGALFLSLLTAFQYYERFMQFFTMTPSDVIEPLAPDSE